MKYISILFVLLSLNCTASELPLSLTRPNTYSLSRNWPKNKIPVPADNSSGQKLFNHRKTVLLFGQPIHIKPIHTTIEEFSNTEESSGSEQSSSSFEEDLCQAVLEEKRRIEKQMSNSHNTAKSSDTEEYSDTEELCREVLRRKKNFEKFLRTVGDL